MSNDSVKIALPNKGRLYKETIDFLEKCALYVYRDNERQYQAKMKGIKSRVEVIFQRANDIPRILEEGRVDLGITGFDIYNETGGDEVIPVFPNRLNNPEEVSPDCKQIPPLPYGNCALVIAVPDHWVDISTISDLAELAMIRKKQNRMLRVATEFPNLTKNHLFGKGVSYFELIEVHGAAESAPRMGSADFVVDLKSSGVTLSENRLKEIIGGEILKSSACLLASRKTLSLKRAKQEITKQIIDRIEAHIKAKKYYLITANMEGANEDDICNQLKKPLHTINQDLPEKEGPTENNNNQEITDLDLLGKEGPTVARVFSLKDKNSAGKNMYSVSVQVEANYLERVINILRSRAGKDILVVPISFVFDNKPEAYDALKLRLAK